MLSMVAAAAVWQMALTSQAFSSLAAAVALLMGGSGVEAGSEALRASALLAISELLSLIQERSYSYYGCYMATDDLYTRFQQHPLVFRGMTNFLPRDFDELFDRVEPFINGPVDVRGNRRAPHLQGAPRALGPSGRPVGRPPNMSLKSRFLIFLATLKEGWSLITQIGQCGQNQQGLSDDFHHFLIGILIALDDEIRWPNAAERQTLEGAIYGFRRGLFLVPIGIVDGTPQFTNRPVDKVQAALMYNGRKKRHGHNHQVCCRWDGHILGVQSFYLHANDTLCYQLTPWHQSKGSHFSGQQTLLADAGYEGCGLLHVRKNVSTDQERAFNALVRRHRVLIEFVFGALKTKFKIVQKTWTHTQGSRDSACLHTASDTFFACCQLLNYWMDKYGHLRGAKYRVRHELEVWEERLLQHVRAQGGAHAPRGWDADDLIFQMVIDGNAADLLRVMEDAGVL